MRKASLFFAACILAAMSCAAAYRLIGSSIDADGFLREPFFLIPVGYMLFLVGLVGAAFFAIRYLLFIGKQPGQ